jgi:long-subunit acyl-CoA synthetase (AMP-forming)
VTASPCFSPIARAGVLLFRLFQNRRRGGTAQHRFQVAESVYALNHSGAAMLIGQSDLIAPLLKAQGELDRARAHFRRQWRAAGHGKFFRIIPGRGISVARDQRGTACGVLYTSGTTSRPKGVMHSHATLGRQTRNYLVTLGVPAYAQTLIFLPLCHIAACSILLLSATASGGTLTILPCFEPGAVLRIIGENKITLTADFLPWSMLWSITRTLGRSISAPSISSLRW